MSAKEMILRLECDNTVLHFDSWPSGVVVGIDILSASIADKYCVVASQVFFARGDEPIVMLEMSDHQEELAKLVAWLALSSIARVDRPVE